MDAGGRAGPEGKSKSTIWSPNPQAEPVPIEVKTGITDGAVTELFEGPVKEGDEVIVGFDLPKRPHGERPGGALPPGFGSPRRS